MSLQKPLVWLFSLFILCGAIQAQTSKYSYIRIGNRTDVETKPTGGVAMMGGGKDLDDAFRWLCSKSDGGDFLILAVFEGAEYNDYVNKLCKVNSVATLVIPNRLAALDPAVADIIHHAEAIFIVGGDQSHYINYWRETPVMYAINAHVASGKPLGGTSAGLAVQGEFVYTAMNDTPDGPDLTSPPTLVNPFQVQVALARDFLRVPHLKNLLTDSHFAKRDRLGRSLVFLSRIVQDGWSPNPREIAVDERSAVLVEADGKATVVGKGKGAYFMQVKNPPEVCKENVPLTFRGVDVYHGPTGAHFDLEAWSGSGGESYSLSVENGVVHSNRADNALY